MNHKLTFTILCLVLTCTSFEIIRDCPTMTSIVECTLQDDFFGQYIDSASGKLVIVAEIPQNYNALSACAAGDLSFIIDSVSIGYSSYLTIEDYKQVGNIAGLLLACYDNHGDTYLVSYSMTYKIIRNKRLEPLRDDYPHIETIQERR